MLLFLATRHLPRKNSSPFQTYFHRTPLRLLLQASALPFGVSARIMLFLWMRFALSAARFPALPLYSGFSSVTSLPTHKLDLSSHVFFFLRLHVSVLKVWTLRKPHILPLSSSRYHILALSFLFFPRLPDLFQSCLLFTPVWLQCSSLIVHHKTLSPTLLPQSWQWRSESLSPHIPFVFRIAPLTFPRTSWILILVYLSAALFFISISCGTSSLFPIRIFPIGFISQTSFKGWRDVILMESPKWIHLNFRISFKVRSHFSTAPWSQALAAFVYAYHCRPIFLSSMQNLTPHTRSAVFCLYSLCSPALPFRPAVSDTLTTISLNASSSVHVFLIINHNLFACICSLLN